MTDIVHQGKERDVGCFFGGKKALFLHPVAKPQRLGVNPQRVLKPIVSGAGENRKVGAQLGNMQKPLKKRVVNYRRYLPNINALVRRNPDIFFIKLVGHRIYVITNLPALSLFV